MKNLKINVKFEVVGLENEIISYINDIITNSNPDQTDRKDFEKAIKSIQKGTPNRYAQMMIVDYLMARAGSMSSAGNIYSDFDQEKNIENCEF